MLFGSCGSDHLAQFCITTPFKVGLKADEGEFTNSHELNCNKGIMFMFFLKANMKNLSSIVQKAFAYLRDIGICNFRNDDVVR